MSAVSVIGGGLAGCEAAWQLAERGLEVTLYEMKPLRRTPAQNSDALAELVCSNSLRSSNSENAVGLLKEEMHRLGSLIIQAAQEARVPAGDALAVDRERFAYAITSRIEGHTYIRRETRIVERLDEIPGDVVVATGPLTDTALAQDIARHIGPGLSFYDAIAPIIAGDSIDRMIAFLGSRYGKGSGDDYLNCPMDRPTYEAFIAALVGAECMPLHDFEDVRFFEGCLPVEEVARRGEQTLRFGALKPVGLGPRDERRPYAVVQLRREDAHGVAWNLVGFQTKLKYPEQSRVFRMIPGLAHAEFLRLGSVHRNTYLDAPRILADDMSLARQGLPRVRFAGQITGVEGYVESAAHGLLVGRCTAAALGKGVWFAPPLECALGALWGHTRGALKLSGRPHEPHNINWSLFPPVEGKKDQRRRDRLERARTELARWAISVGTPIAPIETRPATASAQAASAPA